MVGLSLVEELPETDSDRAGLVGGNAIGGGEEKEAPNGDAGEPAASRLGPEANEEALRILLRARFGEVLREGRGPVFLPLSSGSAIPALARETPPARHASRFHSDRSCRLRSPS